ncbi:hypothetical protein [Rhodanobacter ginsenosidimutans]|uniref:Uncharacterized protein n=1 Tax=Rhodanobacter ginsenosidimutans TaxID=490571 RepID=A0ABW0JQY2_9GAMM
MNDCIHRMPERLYGAATATVIAFSLLTPPSVAAECPSHVRHIYPANATTDATPQSSTVLAGGLHDRIGPSAKAVLGELGIQRLESFLQLRAGWDGPTSKPIRLDSIDVFSQFFSDTALRPEQMGVFMSAEGNVVVNWLDKTAQLVELEFDPDGVNYFIENGEIEGTISANDLSLSGVPHAFKNHAVI